MRKPLVVTMLLVALTAWLLTALHASTQGVQTFEFLGKSGSTIWVAEDIGGEYCLSRLHHIVLEADHAAAGTSDLKEYGNWQPVRDLLSRLELETAVPLRKLTDGSLVDEKQQLQLTPPPPDPALMDQFHEHIRTGGSNAQTWTQQTGQPRIQPPRLNGQPAGILYSYPAGLYVSYTLDRAWYFPRSGRILLFTHQPTRAVGLDTMHGLMLLNLPQSSEKTE